MADKSVLATRWEPASWWGAALLGAVLVAAGIYVLGDVVFATRVSAIIFGIMLLIAGAAEIIHAFSSPHWRGVFLRLLIGAAYAIGGLMLIANPLAASVILTFLLGAALIASGVVRIFQAFQYWHWFGGLLLASGIIGIVAGLVILAKWPISGLWVIGFLVGVDLLIHGFWWLLLGWHTYTTGDEPSTPEAAIYRR